MRRTATLDDVEYRPDRQFRVVKEGGRLSGWTPIRGGHQGWGQDLHVGDVVTCTGFGPGWGSDPGYGVEFRTDESQAAHAGSCMFWPSNGSPFNYRPPVGFLEPVDAKVDA